MRHATVAVQRAIARLKGDPNRRAHDAPSVSRSDRFAHGLELLLLTLALQLRLLGERTAAATRRLTDAVPPPTIDPDADPAVQTTIWEPERSVAAGYDVAVATARTSGAPARPGSAYLPAPHPHLPGAHRVGLAAPAGRLDASPARSRALAEAVSAATFSPAVTAPADDRSNEGEPSGGFRHLRLILASLAAWRPSRPRPAEATPVRSSAATAGNSGFIIGRQRGLAVALGALVLVASFVSVPATQSSGGVGNVFAAGAGPQIPLSALASDVAGTSSTTAHVPRLRDAGDGDGQRAPRRIPADRPLGHAWPAIRPCRRPASGPRQLAASGNRGRPGHAEHRRPRQRPVVIACHHGGRAGSHPDADRRSVPRRRHPPEAGRRQHDRL